VRKNRGIFGWTMSAQMFPNSGPLHKNGAWAAHGVADSKLNLGVLSSQIRRATTEDRQERIMSLQQRQEIQEVLRRMNA
jgi:hypothetical protein